MTVLSTALFHSALFAKVSFESQTLITDRAMFFDGNKVGVKHTANNPDGYDYVFGNALSPHGDCIKVFQHFVFMTWYRGGVEDRHVMLSRFNTKTGVLKTITFPHRHTGFKGKWWLGETHNTIAVGISPKNGSIHLLYDMHRNGNVPAFDDDYLRYSFSKAGAATVSDEQFTLQQFVNSKAGHFKHLKFPGIDDVNTTRLLTYPAFFADKRGDLFMKMRFGYSANGKMLFARYDGNQWHGYDEFNSTNASEKGSEHNWGLYGDFKYVGGKFRIAFQRRSKNKTDKYKYQNGIYYAYSNDRTGKTEWKTPNGKDLNLPVIEADLIKIAEPGDWVKTSKKDQVFISHGFDFTVTDAGDEHFVSQIRDQEFNVIKNLHTYRKVGDKKFTTEAYNGGNQLYTSGNNVYVIGLKNGRVNIVLTKGGTSDFKQVYQHQAGPKFDKGVVNVADGKVYYYLKQAEGTGDKRKLYLQVFDL
ncbi:BNR-4 repeat-containing protein [Algibacillus agarilyticus]|uniref:BNR-4 repeat-containing protein n=1 Tax=Algibacillus agarilyticus TaxID=2234133 RepID=UPI000DD0E46F|nr:BNR-4 repeat-containing protein [Algibacillus agarilyticus]